MDEKDPNKFRLRFSLKEIISADYTGDDAGGWFVRAVAIAVVLYAVGESIARIIESMR